MLIFRYDDFSAVESIKIEIDDAIFRAFQAHKIPLIVSVTPKMVSDVHDAHDHSYSDLGTDQRRLDMLRGGLDLGWELVLHGLTHRRTTFQDNTEFAGCSRREQMMLLDEGREKLLTWFPGAALKTFVPPWNSYDSVTVEAAAANGFDVLCAGPDVKPTVEAGLRIIPSEMTIDDLMTFVQVFSARRLLADLAGASVVVTFHEYEFKANDEPSRERLDALRSTLSQLAQAEALCGTIGAAGRSSFDLSKHLAFQANLAMVRRLQSPRGRDFLSALRKLSQGPTRDALEPVLRGGAAASYLVAKTARSVRQRIRPSWRSLLRTTAVVAGRFAARTAWDSIRGELAEAGGSGEFALQAEVAAGDEGSVRVHQPRADVSDFPVARPNDRLDLREPRDDDAGADRVDARPPLLATPHRFGYPPQRPSTFWVEGSHGPPGVS